ncbi:hypothetical protein ACJZ2D_005637 [Fusarium nematophilum]
MAVTDQFTSFSNTVNGESTPVKQVTQAVDPSTREKLWDVPVASHEDVENAVESAGKAFKTWSQTKWSERQELLLAARDVIVANREKLAPLLTKEGGKPVSSQEPLEDTIIQDDESLQLISQEKPVGVVAAICPWNFPLVLAFGKIAAALVTGNCIIVKPSPFTPYSILKVIELLRPVFPPGVLQALNGDDTLGPALVNHPAVDKISFTGSTATGKKIAAAAAKALKPVTLELGGNNASIICPDVDPAAVAPQVAIGSFFNSGQLCVASKRVYVHEDIYDEFLKAMVENVKQWSVGATTNLEAGINLGPIQNEMQYNIVKRFFEDTAQNGYKFALGSKPDGSEGGFIVKPAIIDNPPDDSLVVTGEAFGPIVPLLKWKDEDEVIQRANDTLTGLGGAVWSKDIGRARRLADRIEAGTIWINSFEKPLPQAHLAGYKESGLGGEWGREGLRAYCKPKVIHLYK